MAHTRSLVFLRRHLGGPRFDREAVWEEHTRFEFAERSVARTMATMVDEPYVIHVPTMIGGRGRSQLTAFYRDHFIFSNPPDTEMESISRTVGPDRVVDEFIFRCTHTAPIPWMLPHVRPTHRRLAIPMVAVVNIRGDRLCHEHIWWDQATALRQAGLLPTHLPAPDAGGGAAPPPTTAPAMTRLPVVGAECARLLAGDARAACNELLDPAWPT
ncbi:hypothetical protein CDD83_5997 [Cordyceps sp. RAO-2017]|nr:hypothetical protein CDD83_5997 [Cordyceps sp. RAO-2017]